MSKMITIESPHEFYYATEGKVTAKSLAESLIGLEGIVKQSVKASCQFAGLKSQDVQVIIDSVTIASYKDSFIVRMLFGNEDQVEAKIDKLRASMKLDKLDEINDMKSAKILSGLIGIGIAGSLCYGAYLWMSPEEKKERANQIIITNSFNSIGTEMNLKGEDVQKIISSALPPGQIEELKKNTVRVLSPGGQSEGGTVTIDGKKNLMIPSELVETVPVKYEKPDQDDPFRMHKDVDITIRALDLDKPDQGWIAVIEDFTDRRIKMTLAEGIDPNSLPIGKVFKADVMVVYKQNIRGRSPKEYQLVEVK